MLFWKGDDSVDMTPSFAPLNGYCSAVNAHLCRAGALPASNLLIEQCKRFSPMTDE
jgi:hypothetical protein